MVALLQNKQIDFAIGISALPIIQLNADMKEWLIKLYGGKQDVNSSYLHTIKYEADSTINANVYLKGKDLNMINADAGIIYQLKMSETFLEIYNKCKVLIIHRQNVGDA